MTQFSIKNVGTLGVLKVPSRLDSTNSLDLEEKIDEILAERKKILFDFSENTYVSSFPLRIFLKTATHLKEMNGDLAFCSFAPSVQQIFDLAGFSSIFTIYPTESEAISKLAL